MSIVGSRIDVEVVNVGLLLFQRWCPWLEHPALWVSTATHWGLCVRVHGIVSYFIEILSPLSPLLVHPHPTSLTSYHPIWAPSCPLTILRRWGVGAGRGLRDQ